MVVWHDKSRPAFSMISAIVVLVLMSSLSVMVLSTNIKSSRHLFEGYRARQAELWANSYMEYAKLAIMKNRELIIENNTTHAIESISGKFGDTQNKGGYIITVQISYMGVKKPFNSSSTRVIDKRASNPSAIIDVYVKYSAMEPKWDNHMTCHIREIVGI